VVQITGTPASGICHFERDTDLTNHRQEWGFRRKNRCNSRAWHTSLIDKIDLTTRVPNLEKLSHIVREKANFEGVSACNGRVSGSKTEQQKVGKALS
jgi:hypothetical protein